VNHAIWSAARVSCEERPYHEAVGSGAMALFGEKYGDVVRVVEIDGFSRELCGGTHVRTTAEIGPFAIVSEGSVGSGARRIEAVTSGEAFALLQGRAREADELRAELASARKEAKKAPATASGEQFVVTRETKVGDVNVLVVDVASGDALEVSDRLKQQHAPAAVVVGALANGTAQLVISLDKTLEARGLNAGSIIREPAALIGGGGGGRPTMARAGGKNTDRLPDALALAERTILDSLG
ncbi:MAG: alanine--tRNA ligase, partial [Actinobacteria bacterium]|nr:alanine--tRNA ligase [Actinomycetota bacterium]